MNKLAIRNVNEYSLPSFLVGVLVSGDTQIRSPSVALRGHPCVRLNSPSAASLSSDVKQVRLKEINLEPTLSQDRVLVHVT